MAVDEDDSILSAVFTGDEDIRTLNRVHRGHDKPTDVLAFSQLEGKQIRGEIRVLGDVVISMDTAARQAGSLGHSLRHELERLLVHGVLHLLGYDHVHGGREAARMVAEENRILHLLRTPGGR